MSEVDRLSNSGLYPALPIADKRSGSGSSNGDARRTRDDKRAPEQPAAQPTQSSDPAQPRPPKSLIDEYA